MVLQTLQYISGTRNQNTSYIYHSSVEKVDGGTKIVKAHSPKLVSFNVSPGDASLLRISRVFFNPSRWSITVW